METIINVSVPEYIGLFSSTYFVMEQARLYDRLTEYEIMKEYLQVCIDNGLVDAMFHIASYYDDIKEYDNMIKYYEMAAELNDTDSMYNLGLYYFEIDDEKNMLKWYLKAVELNDVDSMCKLALHYKITRCNEKVKHYYTLAIKFNYLKAYYLYGLWLDEKGNSNSMAELYISAIELYNSRNYYDVNTKEAKAINANKNYDTENVVTKMIELLAIYYDNEKNKETAIKYYKLAVDRESISAMFNLGQYYFEHDEIENMFKYYLMGIKLKDVDCMFELSLYYQKINDVENMKKYYIMALDNIEKNEYKKTLLNDGEKDFNLFMVKEILDSISENPPQHILNKLKKINSIKDIMIFDNKKKLFTSLNHIVECGICYETCLNINLSCGHCVCTTCYPHLYKKACPFCRF